MGIKGIAISLLLAGVFAFAMISFGIQFANDNNTNVSIIQDSTINSTFAELNTNLSSALGGNTQQKEQFEKDEPIVGSESLLLTSIVGAWKVFITVPTAIWNLSFGLMYSKVFGGDPNSGFAVVFQVFGAILVIVIILGAWRLVKGGE